MTPGCIEILKGSSQFVVFGFVLWWPMKAYKEYWLTKCLDPAIAFLVLLKITPLNLLLLLVYMGRGEGGTYLNHFSRVYVSEQFVVSHFAKCILCIFCSEGILKGGYFKTNHNYLCCLCYRIKKLQKSKASVELLFI